ncbi:hypothetical protein M1L60_03185 [Actinoplanes sp. TRM 88003]|uniref:Uncharacterized protein n=1 Tax=Paractinoplanes aksuensis TaxID=2939490 RepID=A0ABT1DIE3_9ACTN|nr:hypothetical protein [Actinoplanes aksuensis]MCO8269591.1 hypothetical protein [Actinoplanes aksuensis]
MRAGMASGFVAASLLTGVVACGADEGEPQRGISAGAPVDVYVDGVLLGGSPEGSGDVTLNCPPS